MRAKRNQYLCVTALSLFRKQEPQRLQLLFMKKAQDVDRKLPVSAINNPWKARDPWTHFAAVLACSEVSMGCTMSARCANSRMRSVARFSAATLFCGVFIYLSSGSAETPWTPGYAPVTPWC
jgi:hypothetical protein